MTRITTEHTAPTIVDRFGRVAANGIFGMAALGSTWLPMTGFAQSVTDAAPQQSTVHSFILHQCVTVAQLQTAGQRSVLQVEKMVPVATNRPIIIYSANVNGSVGYELVADRPVALDARGQFTQPQTPACYAVSGQLLNVRLNDTRTRTVRSDFFQPIANSALNNSIQVGMRNGAGLPVLQADTLTRGRRGVLVTVFSSGANGFVLLAGPTGLTTRTDTTRAPAITQHSASYFPLAQQVAAPKQSGN